MSTEITELHAEVTFHIQEGAIDALKEKAREIDEAGDDIPEEYTLAQALQVVWHLEPEWLHEHLLAGWTLDRTADDDGTMRGVWL
jgi:thioredoxin-like negative regulator of GroEL